MCGWFQLHNIAISWLHLASWNLPDFQPSCKPKMDPECGNIKNHVTLVGSQVQYFFRWVGGVDKLRIKNKAISAFKLVEVEVEPELCNIWIIFGKYLTTFGKYLGIIHIIFGQYIVNVT